MGQDRISKFAQRQGLSDAAVEDLRQVLEEEDLDAIDTLHSRLEAGAADIELEPGRAPRFEDLGLIASGGMGEVRRVRDLDRVMAMKVIRESLMKRPGAPARFVDEARATARLQHPGIVPVHQIGRLPDGRLFFTMQEIRGRTLEDAIVEVHQASAGQRRWMPADSGWTFRRLIATFRKVCDAVAYAHSMGVIHRDLKPNNVMVGSFGEALVVDWGLFQAADQARSSISGGDLSDTAAAEDTQRQEALPT